MLINTDHAPVYPRSLLTMQQYRGPFFFGAGPSRTYVALSPQDISADVSTRLQCAGTHLPLACRTGARTGTDAPTAAAATAAGAFAGAGAVLFLPTAVPRRGPPGT